LPELLFCIWQRLRDNTVTGNSCSRYRVKTAHLVVFLPPVGRAVRERVANLSLQEEKPIWGYLLISV